MIVILIAMDIVFEIVIVIRKIRKLLNINRAHFHERNRARDRDRNSDNDNDHE